MDVTAEDLTIWEPDRFANFIADQVFKIAAVIAPEGFESFQIEVLGVSPVGRDDLLRSNGHSAISFNAAEPSAAASTW